MSPWRFAWRQTRGMGALALVASAGILLTVTLFILGPLYLNTVERLAFEDFLEAKGNNLDPHLFTAFSSFSPGEYRPTREAIHHAAQGALGEALDRRGVYATAYPIRAALTAPPGQDAVTTLTYRDGFTDHVAVVEGRRAEYTASGPIEVVIGRPAADRIGLEIGQQFRLNTRLPPPALSYDAVLVGTVEPLDAEDPYWFQVGGLFYERLDAQRNNAGLWMISAFLTEETLVERIGQETPALLGIVTDTLYIDAPALHDMGLPAAETALAELEGRLSAAAPRTTFISLLAAQLPDFRVEVARNQMPLIILLVILAAILLYALAMIAVTVGRRTEGIVGLLRSRGAGRLQTVTLVLAWALGAAALALAAAPLITYVTIQGLGGIDAWRAALDGATLNPAPIIPALPWLALGAAVTVLIMALPVIGVSRVSVSTLQSERSRPMNLPWFRRVHLDIVLLAVAAAVLWQIQVRGAEGGLTAAQTDGAPEIDRAVLIMPVLTTFAGLLVLYRLLPYVLRIGITAARAVGRLPVEMALERLSRASTPAAALGGLLFLFGVLGVFAATFGGTLDRAAADQATFQAGVDARIDRYEGYSGMSIADTNAAFHAIDGVEDASAAYAGMAGIGSIQVGTLVPILGIDPSSIGGLLEFRDDFADVPMSERLVELSLIDAAPGNPRVIPNGTESLGLWVKPQRAQGNRFLWLQLVDGLGRPDTYSLGALDFAEWRFLETRLARGDRPPPPGPHTLTGIMIYEPVEGPSGTPGSLELDDLTATDGAGQRTVIEDFSRTTDWLPVLLTGERRDVISTGSSGPERRGTLRFEWGRDTRDGIRGIYLTPGASAIPVLASDDLLRVRGWETGSPAAVHISDRLAPIRIVGTISGFPTIEPGSAGFLIANGQSLINHVNAVSVRQKVWPNRVFVSLPDDPDRRAAVLDAIAADGRLSGEVTDRVELQARTQRSALSSAGWRGMTLLALVAGVGALAIGVAAHAAGAASNRAGEMAVLRALGMPRRAALMNFVVEYVAIVIPAVAGSVVLGLYLSRVLVPRFQGLVGTEPVPSLILSPDWRIAGIVIGLMCLAGLGLAVALWRAYVSQRVAWVLRGMEA